MLWRRMAAGCSRCRSFARRIFSRLHADKPRWSFNVLFVVPPTLFGLGCWQVQRLRWKEDLLAKIETRLHAEPLDLYRVLDANRRADDESNRSVATRLGADVDSEYMPFVVYGYFVPPPPTDDRRFCELQVAPRQLVTDSRKPPTGVNVFSRFVAVPPDGRVSSAVRLVLNRGFVAYGFDAEMPPPTADERESFRRQPFLYRVVGNLRVSEKKPMGLIHDDDQRNRGVWNWRDLSTFATVLEADALSLDVRTVERVSLPLVDVHDARLPSTSAIKQLFSALFANAATEVKPVRPATVQLATEAKYVTPVPGQTRTNLPNDHLTYLITWYMLSVLTSMVIYHRFGPGRFRTGKHGSRF